MYRKMQKFGTISKTWPPCGYLQQLYPYKSATYILVLYVIITKSLNWFLVDCAKSAEGSGDSITSVNHVDSAARK